MFLQGIHILLRGGLVMWPLLACAVLSLTVIIERLWAFRGSRRQAQGAARLGALDTIITVAPLLGLLGTVTGMIRAFHVMDAGRGLSAPILITAGVAEALIATATGLAIAIVTLIGYNALSEMVRLRPTPASPPAAAVHARVPAMKRARIEIIPMIDTIFFLLVFFMMVSLSQVPLSAPRVHLPLSETARIRPQTKIVVTLAPDGTFFLDREAITEAQVLPVLTERLKAQPALTVVINCDKEQPFARFSRIFDLVKRANAGSVMVATSPKDVPIQHQ